MIESREIGDLRYDLERRLEDQDRRLARLEERLLVLSHDLWAAIEELTKTKLDRP